MEQSAASHGTRHPSPPRPYAAKTRDSSRGAATANGPAVDSTSRTQSEPECSHSMGKIKTYLLSRLQRRRRPAVVFAALKGLNTTAQGVALVVPHKSRSGRFLDPSGAVIPWPLRPRVALRSTRGYIPWPLRGRRHRCHASSAGGRRHSGRPATQWGTDATRLTVLSSPRMGRWIVATGGVRHRRTEPVVIHALTQPPRRGGRGAAGQRLIPPVDQDGDV